METAGRSEVSRCGGEDDGAVAIARTAKCVAMEARPTGQRDET
jgi:hypothetical protein